jgi:hypothetical protein
MAQPKTKTSKPAVRKDAQRSNTAQPCRRCGPECFCTDEEIDSGGPAT